jgi:DNA (cytosine-5)-methyltransferase 1
MKSNGGFGPHPTHRENDNELTPSYRRRCCHCLHRLYYRRGAEPVRFGSVCSGIEAASVAWHPLGWQTSWVSEIEPFPCSLLAHKYPETPNFGDMTQFKEWPNDPIDLLVGGTPCQSFSIAGLRPRWVVWENVPGVLSDKTGAFGSFLGGWGNSGMGSPTGFLTLSTSEWPKDAAVCSLSDTLETGDVPARFYLSPKACAGILRRAEKRGKDLPGFQGDRAYAPGDVWGSLSAQGGNNGGGAGGLPVAPQVRRLTPRECERLQGFPDDYTLVPHRNKPAADGPRYKSLGNSMAVPVMRWIGERIQHVEGI